MPTIYTQAFDDIMNVFNTAWQNVDDIAGYVPFVMWQGLHQTAPSDTSKFWARASIQGVWEKQATLANPVRRFDVAGIVIIQIFCPRSDVAAFRKGQQIAELVKNAFRCKTANGVWLKNSRIKELSPEDSYERFNVMAEYEYSEIA